LFILDIQDAQAEIRKKRIREQTDYQDLRDEPAAKKTALKLVKGERYLTGPTPVASSLASGSDTDVPYMPPEEVRQAVDSFHSFLNKKGDQIGRIFAYWVMVYFEQCFF
jgi:hypothetical protein